MTKPLSPVMAAVLRQETVQIERLEADLKSARRSFAITVAMLVEEGIAPATIGVEIGMAANGVLRHAKRGRAARRERGQC